jgi:hypothetical protein
MSGPSVYCIGHVHVSGGLHCWQHPGRVSSPHPRLDPFDGGCNACDYEGTTTTGATDRAKSAGAWCAIPIVGWSHGGSLKQPGRQLMGTALLQINRCVQQNRRFHCACGAVRGGNTGHVTYESVRKHSSFAACYESRCPSVSSEAPRSVSSPAGNHPRVGDGGAVTGQSSAGHHSSQGATRPSTGRRPPPTKRCIAPHATR